MTLTHVLTAADIAALRRSDTLVFRCVPTKMPGEPFAASIDAIEPRGDRNVTTNLPLDSPQVIGYDTLVTSVDWLVSPAKFTPEVATLLAFLRPGDHLRIQVTANNTSEAMRDAGIGRNELRILVTRERKRGAPQVHTFLVDVETAPTSSQWLIRQVKTTPSPRHLDAAVAA